MIAPIKSTIFCPKYLQTEVATSDQLFTLLVFQPVWQVIQLESTPLKNGIKYESSGVEELEDKSDCNTTDQKREEHQSLKQSTASCLEA